MPLQRVLIIGGGLGGPALALALARQNIRSIVFELRAEPSTGGGSISLAPNALRALDQVCGVHDRLRRQGSSYKSIEARSEAGYRFGEIAQSDDEYDALRIMRPTLHRELLDACNESELVDLRFGARFTHIEEAEGRVTAHFENSSSETGDLLIGADGIHSRVREHVLGDAAPTPVYAGTVIINGFAPRAALDLPPDYALPAFVMTARGFVALWPIDPKGETVAWGVNEVAAERDRDGWRAYEVSGEASRQAKAAYAGTTTEPIRSLLDSVKDEDTKLWAPYQIPDIPTWRRGRVLLIGDAAHCLPPNGQGSAMAFEDAAYLARLLGGNPTADILRILDRFEAVRRARIDGVRKSSHAVAATKTSTPSAIGWWLKSWAMTAYFTLKGGVLRDHRISAFDVTRESVELSV